MPGMRAQPRGGSLVPVLRGSRGPAEPADGRPQLCLLVASCHGNRTLRGKISIIFLILWEYFKILRLKIIF